MEAQMDFKSPLWSTSQIEETWSAKRLEGTDTGSRLHDLDYFNQLVLEYQDLVFNQAYRILGERQAAEDVAQEAFILAFRKFHTYNGGSMRAWLLRIVTNLCYDEFRRESRIQTVSLEPVDGYGEEIESPDWLADLSDSPEEAAEGKELRDMIQESIGKLPLKNRTALVMIDIQGLDYAEAADIMRCPIGTVKSRLARARLQMRAYLRGTVAFTL